MAESEGFEPPDPFGSTVFKTAAFDRSASSPWYSLCGSSLQCADIFARPCHIGRYVVRRINCATPIGGLKSARNAGVL